MFGYAAFAQPTFASLAGNAIILSLSENIGVADASSQVSNFVQNITEDVLLNDLNSLGAIFIATRNEDIAVNDATTELTNYLLSHSEDTNLAEDETISAQFAASDTEDILAE